MRGQKPACPECGDITGMCKDGICVAAPEELMSTDEHIQHMKAADAEGIEIQQRHPIHCPLWTMINPDEPQQGLYGCSWSPYFEYRMAPPREEPKPGTAHFVIDGQTVQLKEPIKFTKAES